MLKFGFSLLLLFVAALGVPSNNAHAASRFAECTYCTTQAQFNAFGQYVSTWDNNGTFVYLIYNPNTDVAYEVTANIFRQVPAYSATSVLASPDVMENLHFWLPFFPSSKANTSPAGFYLMGDQVSGFGSFNIADTGDICLLFSATPQFAQMSQRAKNSSSVGWLLGVLKQYFGVGPQAIFIFANGDVADYDLYPDLPGATGCSYHKGTSRDRFGYFINDRNSGGNGTSDGSRYVQPKGSQHYDVYATFTITCTYVLKSDGTASLIGCVRQN